MANTKGRRNHYQGDKIVFPEVCPTDGDIAESRSEGMRDERVRVFTSLQHNRLENKRKNLLSSDSVFSPTIFYDFILNLSGDTRRYYQLFETKYERSHSVSHTQLRDVYNDSLSTRE